MMMNKADLSKYLRNPENLNENSIRDVNLLKDDFPYFQTAYLLATKNHHNISSPDFEQILHLSAAYVSDRRVLYDLLYNLKSGDIQIEEASTADIQTEEYETVETGAEEQRTDDTPLIPSGRVIRDSLKDNISETLTSQLQNLDKSDFDQMELIPEIAIDVRKEYGEGIVLDDLDLKIKLLHEDDEYQEQKAAGEIITIEEETHEKPVKAEPEILELDELHSAEPDVEIVPGDSSSTTDEQPEPVVRTESDKEDAIEFDLEENVAKDSEKEVGQAEQDRSGVDAVVEETEQHTFTGWLKTLDEKAGPVTATGREVTDGSGKKPSKVDLIENFINKGSGKIVPPEDGEAVNVDISEDSVKEHDGFITDTLAKIYVKQGYYSKAMFAYEKLILKFPEKSSYFAAQIEEIKKIVRNNL